jgi:hypothetical protein
MIGLADMAMRLAEQRSGIIGFWTRHKLEPCERSWANPATHEVSAEYYKIIDRLSRGEQP